MSGTGGSDMHTEMHVNHMLIIQGEQRLTFVAGS